MEALLELVLTVSFGLPEARRHAELWAQLTRAGTMIGPHDMLIAASALASGSNLATLNTAEFERVAGLRLVPVTRYLV
jgi:tRNA(fMet)-specific endonuclease VapC